MMTNDACDTKSQDTLQRWEHHLGTFNACLLLLNEIQRKWVYLEPVFARGALPAEQARFGTASDAFVGVLRELEGSPHLTRLRDIPRLQVGGNRALQQRSTF